MRENTVAIAVMGMKDATQMKQAARARAFTVLVNHLKKLAAAMIADISSLLSAHPLRRFPCPPKSWLDTTTRNPKRARHPSHSLAPGVEARCGKEPRAREPLLNVAGIAPKVEPRPSEEIEVSRRREVVALIVKDRAIALHHRHFPCLFHRMTAHRVKVRMIP
jgi:hypothetical protein